MERQGIVGDLDSKSKEELYEMLSRQERLLQNKRFIQTLPDKGKRISDFVEKIRHALAIKEEKESKQASLATVRTEFQARYQKAFTQRQHVVSNDADTMHEQNEMVLSNVNTYSQNTATSNSVDSKSSESLSLNSIEVREACGETAEKHTDLVEALERVTLSDEKSASQRDAGKNCPSPNPFSSQPQKKPHYIEVLEKSNRYASKGRFKPNQPLKSDSPSPSQSPGGLTPPSAEARRQRDRKHLDDITAAKLPPLHHSPAQLLSLEESVTLMQEQTKKYQELQAKLAAQKLAEGLAVSMNSYNPEGGALATYREVHDDGTVSEED